VKLFKKDRTAASDMNHWTRTLLEASFTPLIKGFHRRRGKRPARNVPVPIPTKGVWTLPGGTQRLQRTWVKGKKRTAQVYHPLKSIPDALAAKEPWEARRLPSRRKGEFENIPITTSLCGPPPAMRG